MERQGERGTCNVIEGQGLAEVIPSSFRAPPNGIIKLPVYERLPGAVEVETCERR